MSDLISYLSCVFLVGVPIVIFVLFKYEDIPARAWTLIIPAALVGGLGMWILQEVTA